MHPIPDTGYLRLEQIVGRREITPEQAEANKRKGRGIKRPRPAIPAIIPVSSSSWWSGVKTGRYPSPVRLGPRTTAWRASDIRRLVEGHQL